MDTCPRRKPHSVAVRQSLENRVHLVMLHPAEPRDSTVGQSVSDLGGALVIAGEGHVGPGHDHARLQAHVGKSDATALALALHGTRRAAYSQMPDRSVDHADLFLEQSPVVVRPWIQHAVNHKARDMRTRAATRFRCVAGSRYASLTMRIQISVCIADRSLEKPVDWQAPATVVADVRDH